MKSAERNSTSRETVLNVLVTSLVGAAFGLLYAYGFEFISLPLGVLAGAAFGAAIGFRISKRPPRMRYPIFMLRRILLASFFMLIASFVYSYLLIQGLSHDQMLWVTLLPLVGWIGVVVTIGMAIASLDELQRRIQTEAIAIGFGITAIFVGGYALFQFSGLPGINLGLALLVMSGAWLVGKLWTLWRYR
jgi:hypothetical protein